MQQRQIISHLRGCIERTTVNQQRTHNGRFIEPPDAVRKSLSHRATTEPYFADQRRETKAKESASSARRQDLLKAQKTETL